jgi:hypothetical protein
VVLVLTAAVVAALAVPAEARTESLGPHVHKTRVHTPRPHTPRAPRLRAPNSTYKSVRVRRVDGTVMTGYWDSLGTHLRGPDGRTVHCQRQAFGAADIDVACR